MLLLIMYTRIYHDVDVRNSIGITFSHCVGCFIAMHTIPLGRCEKITVAVRCINNVLCSYSKYPAMKAQMPLMRVPFTNALLLIDNGLTNNKQNTFEPLLFVICQRPVAKTYSKIDQISQ